MWLTHSRTRALAWAYWHAHVLARTHAGMRTSPPPPLPPAVTVTPWCECGTLESALHAPDTILSLVRTPSSAPTGAAAESGPPMPQALVPAGPAAAPAAAGVPWPEAAVLAAVQELAPLPSAFHYAHATTSSTLNALSGGCSSGAASGISSASRSAASSASGPDPSAGGLDFAALAAAAASPCWGSEAGGMSARTASMPAMRRCGSGDRAPSASAISASAGTACASASGARVARAQCRALLRTARDVAQGLQHLHVSGVAHGVSGGGAAWPGLRPMRQPAAPALPHALIQHTA